MFDDPDYIEPVIASPTKFKKLVTAPTFRPLMGTLLQGTIGIDKQEVIDKLEFFEDERALVSMRIGDKIVYMNIDPILEEIIIDYKL